MTTDLKTIYVLARFGLRILLLCLFATFGGVGFARTLASLLLLSAIMCVVTGLLRGEHPLAGSLTNWDEAAVYGLLCGLRPAVRLNDGDQSSRFCVNGFCFAIGIRRR